MADVPTPSPEWWENLRIIGNAALGLLAAFLTQHAYRKQKRKSAAEPEEDKNEFSIVSGQFADMRPVRDGVKAVSQVRQDIQSLTDEVAKTNGLLNSLSNQMVKHLELQERIEALQKRSVENTDAVRLIQEKDARLREVEREARDIAWRERQEREYERDRERNR